MKKVVSLALGFWISGLSYGAVTVPNAPQLNDSDKKEWLGAIDDHDVQVFGFESPAEVKAATFGQGLAVAELASGFYKAGGKPSIDDEQINRFAYPVLAGGKVKALLFVTRNGPEETFSVESIGHAKLAAKVAEFSSLWGSDRIALVHDIDKRDYFALKNAAEFNALNSDTKVAAMNAGRGVVMTLNEYRQSRPARSVTGKVSNSWLAEPWQDHMNGDDEFINSEGMVCKNVPYKVSRNYKDIWAGFAGIPLRWKVRAEKEYGKEWAYYTKAKKREEYCEPNTDPKSKKKLPQRCTAIGTPCKFPDVTFKGKMLYVQLNKQDRKNWCWVAASQSVINYYKKEKQTSQCKLVNLLLNEDTCCKKKPADECKKPRSMEDVKTLLKKFQIKSYYFPYPLAFNPIKWYMDAHRPIIMRWIYKGRGLDGHAAVISAFKEDGSKKIRIVNPSGDTEWMTHAKALKSGDRTWRSSLETQK